MDRQEIRGARVGELLLAEGHGRLSFGPPGDLVPDHWITVEIASSKRIVH